MEDAEGAGDMYCFRCSDGDEVPSPTASPNSEARAMEDGGALTRRSGEAGERGTCFQWRQWSGRALVGLCSFRVAEQANRDPASWLLLSSAHPTSNSSASLPVPCPGQRPRHHAFHGSVPPHVKKSAENSLLAPDS